MGRTWVTMFACDYSSKSHESFKACGNMRRALLLSVVLRATKVLAHGGCLNYTVGETWYPGYAILDFPLRN